MNQPKDGADVVRAQGKPSGARRMMHILGAVLVTVVLPAVLMSALVGSLGIAALLVGIVRGSVDPRELASTPQETRIG